MKFDKAQIFVLVVGIAILLAWDPVCKYMGWFQVPVAAPALANTAQAPQTQAPASRTDTPAAPVAQAQAAPAKKMPKIRGIAPMAPVMVSNSELKLIIDPVSGSVLDFIVPGYKDAERKSDIRLSQNLSSALTFTRFDAPSFEQRPVVISSFPQKGTGSLTLTRRLQFADGGILRVVHEWSLGKSGRNIDCKVTLINESAAPRTFNGYGFSGGVLSSWAKVSGDTVRTPSHRLDYMTVKGKFKDVAADEDNEDFNAPDGTAVEWAGVSNKYFCLLLSGTESFTLKTKRQYMVGAKDKESVPVIGCAAMIQPFVLGKDQARTFSFKAYAGPKVISELESFNGSAGRVMHLAWGPLDYLARALLWILVKIHSLGLSYGWSIIVLTLIVRLLFYPATAKANTSMKKMQQVQPKLQQLKEQYKDDPQLMNAKMMELYRTEGVNPFGGCLPLLLQLPVFIALYTTLDGAVELRQVPFWWSPDLAGPDTVCRIPLYFFDLAVNPLVIIMTILMIIQQHITPMGGDPMQKKMMMWMPVVMLLLFYDLPSGLTLYWSVSNLFSIIQLLIQKRGSQQAAPTEPVKQ